MACHSTFSARVQPWCTPAVLPHTFPGCTWLVGLVEVACSATSEGRLPLQLPVLLGLLLLVVVVLLAVLGKALGRGERGKAGIQ